MHGLILNCLPILLIFVSLHLTKGKLIYMLSGKLDREELCAASQKKACGIHLCLKVCLEKCMFKHNSVA